MKRSSHALESGTSRTIARLTRRGAMHDGVKKADHCCSYPCPTASVRGAKPRRGLTLIEAALATIIIGVGVLSIVYAQETFHRQNHWATHAATGAQLANEIREMTLNLPRHDPITGTAYWGPGPTEVSVQDYNDLDDFDGAVFSGADGTGPLNARRQVIPNMTGWTQVVEVDMVDAHDINAYYPLPTDPDDYPEHYLMRMTVIVTHQFPHESEPMEVTRLSWISPN